MRKGELPPMVQVEGGEIGELAYHFNRMSGTINELIAQAVRKQALMKEAELRTLYSQIDAHFLYNTLENIKMLAEIEDQRQISDALTSLGGMMRYNFKWGGEYVTLGQELRHIRNYIEVMNIRFDEPVQLGVDIPPAYGELELLKMSLQPIVENAFKHGWTEEQGERQLRISAIDEGERSVRIVVQDNGEGMPPEVVARLNERLQQASDAELSELSERTDAMSATDPSAQSGYGLVNVQRRIRLFFGNEYGLQVQSHAGEGTEVSLRLPKIILAGGDIRHETTTDY